MRVIFAVICLAWGSLWSLQARAEPVSLPGEWYQVASNAGACADCRVSIERTGRGFSVEANNGWSAVLRPSPDRTVAAVGEGSWKPNFGGVYGGRPFILRVRFADDKLLVIMSVSKADGRIAHIKAAFEKRGAGGEAI